ncbi:MAG TPA: anti-sigma regulatory factor [Acidimicrobiales bacterium]|nr:anti-sigma regulatory factor [Acidimicrobiales bacterium]
MDGRRPTDVAHISITTDADIVKARQVGREMAATGGCGATDLTMVATAISEIARNMLTHAGRGELQLELVDDTGRRSLLITAHDEGPGIADVKRALEDGFTTGDGLGLGLPGARRLMDEFTIITKPRRGTTVIMRKWCGE